ncbi:MAG: 4Fe-4S binding protein [Acidobacteriia bacterium]|nr:4Fe-4S binding protein [Terriglobia bacterium]
MEQYYHAHKIDLTKCRGRSKCMRRCPTQAIRIRGGKAIRSEDLCVDCGDCMAVCPSDAIVPISDPIGGIPGRKYKVVVPTSVLYSQFEPSIHPYIVHLAFKELGFDEVVDVSLSCSTVARAYLKYMKTHPKLLPLIASDCPTTIRLIQVKYPELVEHISPLDVPRELTAKEIKTKWPAKLGLKPEEISVVYVTPCPAKIVSIKQPAEKAISWFDGAIRVNDAYSLLLPHVLAIKSRFEKRQVPEDFCFSIGWATLGGMTHAVNMENWLAVSGLDHVMKILDDIENSRLRNVDFVEAFACMLGCIGGPFNIENPYVARMNSIKQKEKYENPIEINDDEIARKLDQGYYFLENPVMPRPTKYFDTDLETSIKRMKESERVFQKLPQTDCGCCGAPTCMAFAEDLVRGEAKLENCIFLSGKEHGG